MPIFGICLGNQVQSPLLFFLPFSFFCLSSPWRGVRNRTKEKAPNCEKERGKGTDVLRVAPRWQRAPCCCPLGSICTYPTSIYTYPAYIVAYATFNYSQSHTRARSLSRSLSLVLSLSRSLSLSLVLSLFPSLSISLSLSLSFSLSLSLSAHGAGGGLQDIQTQIWQPRPQPARQGHAHG